MWEFTPESVTAVATATLCVLTLVLAYFTARLYINYPQIVVTFEPNPHYGICIEMVIENIGTTIAYDVVVLPKETFYIRANKDKVLNESSFLKQKFIKPRQVIRSVLSTYCEIPNKQIDIEVSYKEKCFFRDKLHKNIISLDMSTLEGIVTLESPFQKAATTLSQISSSLIKIAGRPR